MILHAFTLTAGAFIRTETGWKRCDFQIHDSGILDLPDDKQEFSESYIKEYHPKAIGWKMWFVPEVEAERIRDYWGLNDLQKTYDAIKSLTW